MSLRRAARTAWTSIARASTSASVTPTCGASAAAARAIAPSARGVRFLSGSSRDDDGDESAKEGAIAGEGTREVEIVVPSMSMAAATTKGGAVESEAPAANATRKPRRKPGAKVASEGETATKAPKTKLERSAKEDSNVYVKHMPIGVTSTSLRKVFKQYGPIISALALNPEGPYPGGLVWFARAEDALKAIEATAEGKITLEGASAPLVVRIAEKKGAKEASAQSEESDEEAPRSRRPVGDLNSLLAEEDENLDPVAATAAREEREVQLAAQRQRRADNFANQKAKGQAMTAERRAERIAQGVAKIKTFVPRYKRDGNNLVDLQFDPSLRASTSSRRMRDGEMVAGISQRKRVARAPSTARAGGRGREAGDAKVQKALNERIRQARALQDANKDYDYNRQEVDRKAILLFTESIDVRHIAEKPRLGSSQRQQSDEEYIDAHKEFIMEMAGITSEQEFEFLKNEAIEAFTQQREYERLQRERAGLSPFRDNFLAERASLAEIVADIPKDNVFHDFAQLALNTLDSNPDWSYAAKKRALALFEKESRYHAD